MNIFSFFFLIFYKTNPYIDVPECQNVDNNNKLSDIITNDKEEIYNQNELNNIINYKTHYCTKKKLITKNQQNKKNKNEYSIIHSSNNKNIIYKEPYNYKDISNLHYKKEWEYAINEELNSMKKLNVFKVVENTPPGTNIISSRWVFKYKRDVD